MEKLAKTFGTNNSTIYWFSETCWGTKVIVGIAFIIDFNWYFLSILGQVFVLISAVAAWEVMHQIKLSNEGSVQVTLKIFFRLDQDIVASYMKKSSQKLGII